MTIKQAIAKADKKAKQSNVDYYVIYDDDYETYVAINDYDLDTHYQGFKVFYVTNNYILA